MSRRALALDGVIPEAPETSRVKVGRMDAARWRAERYDRQGAYVTLDGVPQPMDAVAGFDDLEGWVEKFEGKWKRLQRYAGEVRLVVPDKPPVSDEVVFQVPAPQQEVFVQSASFPSSSSYGFLQTAYAQSFSPFVTQQYPPQYSTILQQPVESLSSSVLECRLCNRPFEHACGPGAFDVNGRWICQPCLTVQET